jgi:hypothetical protein
MYTKEQIVDMFTITDKYSYQTTLSRYVQLRRLVLLNDNRHRQELKIIEDLLEEYEGK